MTNDPEVAAFARAFRDHGQVRDRGLRRFVLPGLNLRMTDFQAALGRSQLNRLDSLLATRRNLFETYLKLLEGVDVGLPYYESTRTAAQSFVIRVPVDVERDKLVESMAQEGVQTGSGTIAMPFSEYFAGAGYADYRHLSVTASLAARALSLPLYHELATSDQRIVVAALVRCIDKLRGTTSGR
jgi:perosamine synthetase